MGFAEDVIYSYVARSLRRVFPLREGWEIKRRPKENDSIPDYFIQKKRFGRTRRILVDVVLFPRVSQEHIDSLRRYAEKMEKLLLPTEELVIVVPVGADTGLVPEDIAILTLDVLKVEGDEIVWVRKHGAEPKAQLPKSPEEGPEEGD